MQATMRLNVVNRETMSVLNRTLNKDNYFERVSVKISLLIKDSLLNNAYALITAYKLHDEILNVSAYLDDEMDKFVGQLEKKKLIHPEKVNFIAKYHYDIPCNNPIALTLYELMDGFDKLISTLKLLHLSGSMDSQAAYYQLKQRYQKKLNTLLSKIILTPSSKNRLTTISDLIEQHESIDFSEIDIASLIEALDMPYAPGFSPQILSNLKYRFKLLLSNNQAKCVEA